MNLPNKLTVMRLIMTPVFLACYLYEFPHHMIIALLVFAAASITDTLDGKIARKYNLITTFGKIADPIADKILTITCVLAFLGQNLCSVWAALIILTREFTVSAIRIQAASQGTVIPANIFGKIKTAFTMFAEVVILLALTFQNEGVRLIIKNVPLMSNILMWICAALTLISGIIYIADSIKVIDYTK